MALPNGTITRIEQYLSAIAGQPTELPGTPITRIEQYLDYIANHGGGGGTSDYNALQNHPEINGVELSGDKSGADLGLLSLSGGTMDGNVAMGGNKVTGLADGMADSDAVTKRQLDDAKVGALKPKGSITFAQLPAPSAAVLNYMYNISDGFTTTSDFVEGAGAVHPAGSNVAIINVGSDLVPVYKYDVYHGEIPGATVNTKGIVQLSSAVDSESETKAATPKAVKTAYDVAYGAPETKLVTLTNTDSFPFNTTASSPTTVALTNARDNLYYMIDPEISSKNGIVDEIIITDKALNGFKIGYLGSASSVSLSIKVYGGME